MQLHGYTPILITAVRQETETVKSFFLARIDGEELLYEAGQFITFATQSYNREVRRPYSFASSPVLAEPASITVKRIGNGLFSRILHDRLQAGDILYSTGISGMFTLPANANDFDTLFFFAAGVGITPIYSLIKTALHQYPHVQVMLIYSNHSVPDTVFHGQLMALEQRYGRRLRVIFLFSSSANLSIARLSKELVPVLLRQHLPGSLEKTLFYLCGPFAYMRMVQYALEEMLVPAMHIRKEHFDTTPVANKPAPPDTTAHMVNLSFKNQAYRFKAQYPETILQAAEREGISLPYSCRNGVCGSCAAKCLQGKVWHGANEVLTDNEMKAGMILTCTAYAIEGDVTISA